MNKTCRGSGHSLKNNIANDAVNIFHGYFFINVSIIYWEASRNKCFQWRQVKQQQMDVDYFLSIEMKFFFRNCTFIALKHSFLLVSLYLYIDDLKMKRMKCNNTCHNVESVSSDESQVETSKLKSGHFEELWAMLAKAFEAIWSNIQEHIKLIV